MLIIGLRLPSIVSKIHFGRSEQSSRQRHSGYWILPLNLYDFGKETSHTLCTFIVAGKDWCKKEVTATWSNCSAGWGFQLSCRKNWSASHNDAGFCSANIFLMHIHPNNIIKMSPWREQVECTACHVTRSGCWSGKTKCHQCTCAAFVDRDGRVLDDQRSMDKTSSMSVFCVFVQCWAQTLMRGCFKIRCSESSANAKWVHKPNSDEELLKLVAADARVLVKNLMHNSLIFCIWNPLMIGSSRGKGLV